MTKPTKATSIQAGGRADGFDVNGAIHGMQDNFIQCRDFGHSWRPYTAQWSVQERCYEVQLRCQRCKTIRLRYIDSKGHQLSSGYQYTDGYLIKGMGRLDQGERDLIRLESVLRILPPDTAAEDAG